MMLERRPAPCGIGRYRAQQVGELARARAVEGHAGTAREPRHLSEGGGGDRVAAFQKEEQRHARKAELAGHPAQGIGRLLAGIADMHRGGDRRSLGLFQNMAQDAADLGLPAAAIDLRHQPRQGGAVGRPAARPALPEPAEPDKLHLEPAQARRLGEHVALDGAGAIPGRPPAHRRVEREDQPAASPGARSRMRREGREKSVDIISSGGRSRGFARRAGHMLAIVHRLKMAAKRARCKAAVGPRQGLDLPCRT